MANLESVIQQLKQEREQAAKNIQRLDAALAALNGRSSGPSAKRGSGLSAAARAKIAAAQRARWAKVRAQAGKKQSNAQKANIVAMPKKKPTLSASTRKRIAAAQRARWARVKAAQNKSTQKASA